MKSNGWLEWNMKDGTRSDLFKVGLQRRRKIDSRRLIIHCSCGKIYVRMKKRKT
jgi:hypothetical protein